jgi:hypothetical protein
VSCTASAPSWASPPSWTLSPALSPPWKFLFFIFWYKMGTFVKWCNSSLEVHCKHTVSKIQNKYSQKYKCSASFPISTIMYLQLVSALYIPMIGPPVLLQQNRSTNRERGRAVSFLAIHKSDLVCNVHSERRDLFGILIAVAQRKVPPPCRYPAKNRTGEIACGIGRLAKC